MIIRATFKNILSFYEETSISFIASKSSSNENQVLRAQKRDDFSILKSGIIYGATASGKSNIIKAIGILKKIVLGSWPRNLIEPFKLQDDTSIPSKIELDFKYDQKYYNYGIIFNNIQGIIEEWLYEINLRTKKKIFTREKNAPTPFSFGALKLDSENQEFLKFLGQGTPDKKSFLFEYHDRNGKKVDAISNAYLWFRDILTIVFPDSKYQGFSFKFDEDILFKEEFKRYLEYFNTGIVDISREKTKEENVDIPKEIIYSIIEVLNPGKKSFLSTPEGDWYIFECPSRGKVDIFKQKTIHEDKNRNKHTFDMREESDGSLKLLDFIPMLINLEKGNSVFLIDEIDRSLHPQLSYKILSTFFSNLSKAKDSQLIASTHERNLLDLKFIRQDEIWFVEKSPDGASHLTSLTEYKAREDIKKLYLIGKYGKIPSFVTPDKSNWYDDVILKI
ncbi:ATP/GTP-binding protein [Fibrobacter succinogenes]|uniref:AAA family ATPase n=1 Tax=Fibrobacter succinogenes TaxID=833 RepID=UPI0015655A9F|nr:ATP-binding protein [Fibrobacter succinogenes]